MDKKKISIIAGASLATLLCVAGAKQYHDMRDAELDDAVTAVQQKCEGRMASLDVKLDSKVGSAKSEVELYRTENVDLKGEYNSVKSDLKKGRDAMDYLLRVREFNDVVVFIDDRDSFLIDLDKEVERYMPDFLEKVNNGIRKMAGKHDAYVRHEQDLADKRAQLKSMIVYSIQVDSADGFASEFIADPAGYDTDEQETIAVERLRSARKSLDGVLDQNPFK